ncbi:hypothetical protein [Myceligenerans pegani]|uniref:Uncharacterized protein n=1 Tax=Myceligenerans pegani TaxID=2776917 RepID=A0ABR9MTR9_9MICO|nr:hypothetical protein [Myceligenerans sp. TRM 65318]MBE1874768.1 hypothetical protein [Myceligenerans sp. TRM 65318]MBE3017039.1 hypothetical protein [Myceligenerans sp. TRM 65318]
MTNEQVTPPSDGPTDPARPTAPENLTGPVDPRRGWGARRFLARRRRIVVTVAAAVMLAAAGVVLVSVRVEASRLVDEAETRHTDGDCAGAVAALDELESLPGLVAGDLVDSSRQDRHACAVLLDATVGQDTFDPEILEKYVARADARWAHAAVVRADMLLLRDESDYIPDDYFLQGTPEEAFELLTTTLEESPEESESVRGVMEAYLERFSAENARYDRTNIDSSYCTTRDEHLDLLDREWTHPELAEPVAATEDVRDEWLLACADETVGIDTLAHVESMAEVGALAGGESPVDLEPLRDARSLYDEYLENHADESAAERARRTRDRIAGIIDTVRENAARAAEHERARDRAVARADDPADGSNLAACGDARCQVRVASGTLIPIGGPGGPYEILVTVDGGTATMQLGGLIRSYSTTGGSIVSGDGYAAWSSGRRGELVLNDKVGIGVDGVSGGRATLSVWRAG